MRHANALAIVIAGTLIAGSLLFASRTVTTPTPFGYVERDRWTGRTIACEVAAPENYAKMALRRIEAKVDYDPPQICVDLTLGWPAEHGPWADFTTQAQPK